jgi:hypothetical protein
MPGRTLAYDVDPGSERFLIGKPVDAETGGQADLSDSAAEASHIVLVQNWLEELTRLVPPK